MRVAYFSNIVMVTTCQYYFCKNLVYLLYLSETILIGSCMYLQNSLTWRCCHLPGNETTDFD